MAQPSLLPLLLLATAVATGSSEPAADPDFDRRIPQLITSRGFAFQEHNVTTADGFILTHYRIVNPCLAAARRPVILQHGLLSTGHDFVSNAPGGDLGPCSSADNVTVTDTDIVGPNMGFELAKRGHDVWLTNSRGNAYSRAHSFLDPDFGSGFWHWSWDQMAAHDLPATIDYVLRVTRRRTLAYVGHSQGTVTMFALLASQPRFNQLVKPFVALAPIAGLAHVATPLRHLARVPFLDAILRRLGDGEFAASGALARTVAARLCGGRATRAVCANLMFLANGYSEAQLNASRVAVYAAHYPAGTSWRNMAHYAQLVRSGRFAAFDHGSEAKNRDAYGTGTPPEYDVRRISSRDIALFSSLNDWLASPADVALLVRRLGPGILLDHRIPVPDWNHLDFLIGREAGALVNRPVARILDDYADRA